MKLKLANLVSLTTALLTLLGDSETPGQKRLLDYVCSLSLVMLWDPELAIKLLTTLDKDQISILLFPSTSIAVYT